MDDGQARRAQQRFDLQLPVDVTYQGRVIAGSSRNLSLGGLFVLLDEEIPFGAVVKITFRTPALKEPVEVQANVRWVDIGIGIGVQFAGLRAREVWALQKLFAEEAARAAPAGE